MHAITTVMKPIEKHYKSLQNRGTSAAYVYPIYKSILQELDVSTLSIFANLYINPTIQVDGESGTTQMAFGYFLGLASLPNVNACGDAES